MSNELAILTEEKIAVLQTEKRSMLVVKEVGAPGVVPTPVRAITTQSMVVTNEDFILVKGESPITIQLKDPTLATKPVTIKNMSTATVTVNVQTLENIDNEQNFFMVPGAGLTYWPGDEGENAQYFVTG